MRKPATKPQHASPKILEPRTLTSTELQQVMGGVMKSRHDTAKNSTSG